uniref:Uncharacterized protein n=1 Tax=Lymantria dispar multicapsid nuclear polyhedrosis virus TaxID=10449 RepID=A0A0A0Z0X4_NPVLD|nr:hypothetical protein [Lymantria dispar multiple nucleopolyhedrovirus]
MIRADWGAYQSITSKTKHCNLSNPRYQRLTSKTKHCNLNDSSYQRLTSKTKHCNLSNKPLFISHYNFTL